MENNNQIDRLKQEFIANASHELKTPVTSIQLAVETAINALEAKKYDDAQLFLNQILKDSERMTLLLSDLLDLSQLESNEPSKEFIELSSVIQSEVSYLSKKNLNRVFIESEEIYMYIDPDDFALIVRNLLRNACSYSEKDTKVKIRLYKNNEDVVLVIKDKGRGISVSDQERIFERFYRVDKGRSRNLGGTGIGLSLVKHAVDRNKGNINIKSQLGEGSIFTVIFKLEDE